MIRFVFNFIFFGLLFYGLHLYVSQVFDTLVSWAAAFFEFFQGLIAKLM